VVDTSYNSVGYSFALVIRLAEEFYHTHYTNTAVRGRKFGSTVPVWATDERNKGGGRGAFSVRFAPGAFEAALNDAIIAAREHPPISYTTEDLLENELYPVA
jgi:hypothetical protein